ncbi:MAG: L-threonylcarbamoyladenylate synthase [Anaerolineae bacterium]|nr:L-threonylcarbamoyladenylate synthase [Anaerolineae bacterium]MDQ7035630.1 L-threonylcarbamoyladenylate synthase [Anaerolineae bacterium]
MPYQAETYSVTVDPQNPDPQVMALAGQVIVDGGLVAFPTETVYGLGANALSEAAVAHIFEAKQRPSNDPLIVHIETVAQLETVAIEIPSITQKLADAFWPGALTFILKKRPEIPANVTAGRDTVAVRLPAHLIAQRLIHKAGVPIAAPSSNLFSRPSPTTAYHVLADLDGHVDVILDGGSTQIGVESTIIDLTSEIPTVLRPGGVTLEALREHLPTVAFRPQHITEDDIAAAPGTLLKHYSPHATVKVFKGEEKAVYEAMRHEAATDIKQGKQVGILAQDNEALEFAKLDVQIVLIGKTSQAMAAALFAGMRALDNSKVDVILARAPQETGLGLALYDRLMRAAEGHIMEVG